MCIFRLSERSVPAYSIRQLTVCPTTVASAAPFTSMPSVNMNIGSSTQFSTAPETSPTMENTAFP